MNRVTTQEAAKILGCKTIEALSLLRAAHVPHERLGGRKGAYLWDSAAVERLRQITIEWEGADHV